MESESDREQLLKEANVLTAKISEINLSEKERKQERIQLLHKYNDTKDHAQLILGSLAELKGISVNALYKKMKISVE
jgi:hypothetical protein